MLIHTKRRVSGVTVSNRDVNSNDERADDLNAFGTMFVTCNKFYAVLNCYIKVGIRTSFAYSLLFS